MTIAVEIVIADGEVSRVWLEEAAQLRLIQPIAIIVELQIAQPLAAGEEKPIANG